MALCLWYPLNGDIHNQGTCVPGYVSQDNTMTYVTKGFLEKSLSNGKLTMNAATTDEIMNNDGFGVSVWVYVNAAAAASTAGENMVRFFGNVGSDITKSDKPVFELELSPTVSDITYKTVMNDDTNGSLQTATASGVMVAGTWNHVCMTYSNGTILVYVNGIVVLTKENFDFNMDTFQRQTDLFNVGRTDVYLQDYRVYSHGLTPKEVAELAKGKMLQYAMNHEFVEDAVSDNSGMSDDGKYTVAPTVVADSPVGKYALEFAPNGGITTAPVVNDKTMTASVWAKFPAGTAGITGTNVLVGSTTDTDGMKIEFSLQAGNTPQLRAVVFAAVEASNSQSVEAIITGADVVALVDNQWHWIVATFDNGAISLYVDGKLSNTATVDNYTLSNVPVPYVIGKTEQSVDLVDARMYMAVFTADEIREMFNTKAAFDNGGNLFCYDVDMSNGNATGFGVSKSGVLSTAAFYVNGGMLEIKECDESAFVDVTVLDTATDMTADYRVMKTPAAKTDVNIPICAYTVTDGVTNTSPIHVHFDMKWVGFVGCGSDFSVKLMSAYYDTATGGWVHEAAGLFGEDDELGADFKASDSDVIIDKDIHIENPEAQRIWYVKVSNSNGTGTVTVSDIVVTFSDRWLDGTNKVKVGNTFISANDIMEL